MVIDSKNTQKNKYRRWIGLAIGLILGLFAGFGYYYWAKNKASVYFQKSIGETKLQIELQKWQVKNPRQGIILATELQKALGIYEELKGETNPEKIQQRALQRMQEMEDEEREKIGKKAMKIYQEYAPSFLETLNKEFPWHLRYYWLIMISLVLVSSGVGLLVGYLLEPKKEAKL